VTYNPKKTDEATIRKAIAKLGFDADDVKGDPVARKKLPQECFTPVKKGSCKHSCGGH
jgi:mercuric ion binding protein